MNLLASTRPRGTTTSPRMAVIALLFGAILAPATHAQAQDDGAKALLKTMSDYVAGQKSISIAYDSDIEVVTADLQKIQFTSSGQLQLSRPDKVHATRTGGYTDVDSSSTARRSPFTARI
jgi:hypothetical protein